jgi:hypothetical protein
MPSTCTASNRTSASFESNLASSALILASSVESAKAMGDKTKERLANKETLIRKIVFGKNMKPPLLNQFFETQ